MKKLTIILISLLGCLTLMGQSGSIIDKPGVIRIYHPDGKMESLFKSEISKTESYNDQVWIVGQFKHNNRPIRLVSMSPSDFGFASDTALMDYLDVLIPEKAYRRTFVYTGSGKIDSVKYYYSSVSDTTHLWSIDYEYSASDTLLSVQTSFQD